MIDNLNDFLLQTLMDIYDAEKKAVQALPRMAKGVSSPEVKKAFQEHGEQTKRQVQRLEEIFSKLGMDAKAKPCAGMEGLVREAEEHLQEDLDPEFRDAALVGAEQKAEHYEMAAYRGALEIADLLNAKHASRLLKQNLAEEERMSRKLMQLSARWVKKTAREEQRAKAA